LAMQGLAFLGARERIERGTMTKHLTLSERCRVDRRLLLGVLAGFVLAGTASVAVAQTAKETITVYTALEKEQLAPYKAAFEKAHPDVEISWLRDSPGIILARLLAEKDNPRADAVWGVPLMHLVSLEKLGMLEPYAPKEYEKLKPRFRDSK